VPVLAEEMSLHIIEIVVHEVLYELMLMSHIAQLTSAADFREFLLVVFRIVGERVVVGLGSLRHGDVSDFVGSW
jgi:hypothetical protein